MIPIHLCPLITDTQKNDGISHVRAFEKKYTDESRVVEYTAHLPNQSKKLCLPCYNAPIWFIASSVLS